MGPALVCVRGLVFEFRTLLTDDTRWPARQQPAGADNPCAFRKLNVQEEAVVPEKTDPKELAESLRSASEIHDERWKKLSPFRDAGWKTYQTDVYKELAGNRLSADYKNGQVELFFFGVGKRISFNSAKDALEYVDAVEKQLRGD